MNDDRNERIWIGEADLRRMMLATPGDELTIEARLRLDGRTYPDSYKVSAEDKPAAVRVRRVVGGVELLAPDMDRAPYDGAAQASPGCSSPPEIVAQVAAARLACANGHHDWRSIYAGAEREQCRWCPQTRAVILPGG
jgi:hypothetical protein